MDIIIREVMGLYLAMGMVNQQRMTERRNVVIEEWLET